MTLLEKEWFIQAPWGRLCIIAWGDCCDPPVLVCHGTKDSAASFRPLIKLLPKKFYYIGMELPGCGRSDPMPPGLMLSLFDLVYSIQVVVKHFRWNSFIYLAHSLGCSLGYIYNISYPGKISKNIYLDPVSLGIAVPPEKFVEWYKRSFKDYFDNYERYTAKGDNKSKYTKEEALAKIMKRRGFNRNTAEETLARVTEPTSDGLLRFTFDDRTEVVTYPPFSPEHVKNLITNVSTPTLNIIVSATKEKGRYSSTSFLFDETAFPSRNYRLKEVSGNHDVHVIHPERVASFVAQFLLHGLEGLDSKAKL